MEDYVGMISHIQYRVGRCGGQFRFAAFFSFFFSRRFWAIGRQGKLPALYFSCFCAFLFFHRPFRKKWILWILKLRAVSNKRFLREYGDEKCLQLLGKKNGRFPTVGMAFFFSIHMQTFFCLLVWNGAFFFFFWRNGIRSFVFTRIFLCVGCVLLCGTIGHSLRRGRVCGRRRERLVRLGRRQVPPRHLHGPHLPGRQEVRRTDNSVSYSMIVQIRVMNWQWCDAITYVGQQCHIYACVNIWIRTRNFHKLGWWCHYDSPATGT